MRLAFGLLLWSAPAWALGPAEIVTRMDAALNAFDDMALTYQMIDQQPGKAQRLLELEVFIKGEKRVTAFTKPADMAGARVLVLSPTQMYIYLPAYKKVRRVASHVTEAGFMGTTYSSNDLAVSTYGDKYDVQQLSEDAKTWTLRLQQKAGAEVFYPKIEVVVNKDSFLPSEFKYFDLQGKRLKTEQRQGYQCEGKVCAPTEMRMSDDTSNGHWTKLVRKNWKVNPGLPERIFTVRDLQRD